MFPSRKSAFRGIYYDIHQPCRNRPQYKRTDGTVKYIHHFPTRSWRVTNRKCTGGGWGYTNRDTPVGYWTLSRKNFVAYCWGKLARLTNCLVWRVCNDITP